MPKTPASITAIQALHAGISVLPIRADGSKQPALAGWKMYQQRLPFLDEVKGWFADPCYGLALVTGSVSGGLIALDFDDAAIFLTWRDHVRADHRLSELYRSVADGYEERTPKGGRHLLFRCPEAFRTERKPGNQKLASRPVPPPRRCETLIETREEGGLIIVYPSHGRVHPTGRPYYLLRGRVCQIKTISADEREQLYHSAQTFDEMPKAEPSQYFHLPSSLCSPKSSLLRPGQRPGDLFNASVTWEYLLHGWEQIEQRVNGAGHLEGYWRHPGKVGPHHSATTNADGTNRLFVFSPSVGLPIGRHLSPFEFFAYWEHGGDFSVAARALVQAGYSSRGKQQRSG